MRRPHRAPIWGRLTRPDGGRVAGAKGVGVRVMAQVLPAPAGVQALDEVLMTAKPAGRPALEIGMPVVPRPLPEARQNPYVAPHRTNA